MAVFSNKFRVRVQIKEYVAVQLEIPEELKSHQMVRVSVVGGHMT